MRQWYYYLNLSFLYKTKALFIYARVGMTFYLAVQLV